MREDILGGLRNALEKGEDMESAIRSFINSGYKESEVRETAKYLETGAISQIPSSQYSGYQQKQIPQSLDPPQPETQKLPAQRSSEKPSNKGRIVLIAFLVIVLLLLLAGFISILFFREQAMATLESLF